MIDTIKPAPPPMACCKFCHRSVEQEQISATRHLAYACPAVPPEVRDEARSVVGLPAARGGANSDGSPAATRRARRGGASTRTDDR